MNFNQRQLFQRALSKFNVGKHQWYGWKDLNVPMSYSNIKLNDDTAIMPSEADVNAKIQELKNAETQKENDKISAQNKLKALGLTDAEIQAL
mgnify:CR=1 FL=1